MFLHSRRKGCWGERAVDSRYVTNGSWVFS